MLPSRRLIVMLLAAVPVLLAGAASEAMASLGLLYLLVLLAYAAIDALLLPGRRSITIRRIVPERLSLGALGQFAVEVHNAGRRRVEINLADDLPEGLEPAGPTPTAVLGHRQHRTVEYVIRGCRRGRHELGAMDVRVLPAMGLFYRQFRLHIPAEVHVFPDLVGMRRYDLLVRRGLLREAGLARIRQLGKGGEFESLRAYVHGDEMTRVDWKATARRGQLFVRNYQPHRQQSVLVALDVGRATAGEFEGLSRLDYLVNAAMLLSYVCLRQGDWFSLVAFSDRIESYLPPIRRLGNIDRVARALYELQPRLVESDYAAACRFMGLKNRKRSLICLMTDVLDRHASGVILAYMARFARHHLPLAVTLANPAVTTVAEQPIAESRDPYSKAAALDVVMARSEALTEMRRNGVDVLDVTPKQLTPELINRYLTIKWTRRL